jgi:hypothetical protein
MAAKNKSTNHHWWPVGLQRYWADDNGDVSWISPDGNTDKKRSAKRKIGFKRHGHTLFRGHIWGESNFEAEFDIDDDVHRIIPHLQSLKPLGGPFSALESWWKSVRKVDRSLTETCARYHIEDQDSRKLLLFLFSLLIRSPSYRSKYEQFPIQFGLPACENVGKANMRQNYLLAKRICHDGVMTNRFFVILHADHSRFICGDGYLDGLSGSLQAGRVSGRALMPLTPHLCVYICTPTAMRTERNCIAIRAAPWVVERVNEITQVYSRDRLFFLGREPRLTHHFVQQQFLEYSNHQVDLLDKLDAIAQPELRKNGLVAFGF